MSIERSCSERGMEMGPRHGRHPARPLAHSNEAVGHVHRHRASAQGTPQESPLGRLRQLHALAALPGIRSTSEHGGIQQLAQTKLLRNHLPTCTGEKKCALWQRYLRHAPLSPMRSVIGRVSQTPPQSIFWWVSPTPAHVVLWRVSPAPAQVCVPFVSPTHAFKEAYAHRDRAHRAPTTRPTQSKCQPSSPRSQTEDSKYEGQVLILLATSLPR